MHSDAEPNPPDPGKPNAPRLVDTVEMAALPIPVEQPVRPEIPSVSRVRIGNAEAAWITMKSPVRETDNEDAVCAFPVNSDRGLLVVADGLGGHRGGRLASQSLVRSFKRTFSRSAKRTSPPEIIIGGGLKVPLAPPAELTDADYRSMILDQIDTVNARLLKNRSGSATTLALVEISGNRARTYHAGDSQVFVISQRGHIKHETVSHSPVGYAVEAGILSEVEAIHHEDRHLVSNVIGTKDLSVEIGPWINLSARDTILLASDGLFDNLFSVEIVDLIRTGTLQQGVHKLAELAIERMCSPQPDLPSKLDDLTILAYRRLPRRKRKSEAL